MEYRVHIYATVRVPVAIEADSQLNAIRKAHEINLHRILNQYIGYEVCDQVEYAEEVTGFLVDEVSDEEYENSKYYDANQLTL